MTVPHKIYKQLITEQPELPVNEATDRPRNVKQIANIRAAKTTELRISRDAIMNLHEMAYEENGFIWHITTYPDLIVLCGLKEVLDLLTETLSWNRVDTLLSYDTTFCLGEFYVSPLLFRCSVFEENPTVPALFLFHERKQQQVHDLLFTTFTTLVKRTAGLPIVVDMEQGIIRAIREKTSLIFAGCWRHLREDLQRRMIAEGIPLKTRNDITDNLYDLLRSRSADQYASKVHDIQRDWPSVITSYYMDNIHGKVEHYGHWSIKNKFGKYFTEHGITTNQSEGFNWLLKDLQGWKEAPVDSVYLSFKLLQAYYLNEIRRGKTGLGTYTLRMEFSDLMIDLSSFSSFSCHPQDIIRSIKEKKIMLQQQSELPSENDCADNSRIVRAQEIRQKDGISSSKLGVFTVYDDRSFHFVKLFPPSCSCPLKEGCVHILSVQLSLNMPIQQSGMKNLTTVRKNARGTRKAKPGRKKPRVGDEDPPNDPELEHENPEQNAEHPVQREQQPPEQSVQHAEHPPEHTEQKTTHAEHQPEHTEQKTKHAEHQPEYTEQKTKHAEHQPEHTEQSSERAEHAERMSEYQPEQEDIIELAGKDSSFARDVKYSEEVWIPHLSQIHVAG